MTNYFFKMPRGCTKSAEIGIIAAEKNISRSVVISVFACASELFFEGKIPKNIAKIISYTLGEKEADVENALRGLQENELLDENYHVSGQSTVSPDALRKRRQREAEKNNVRDMSVTVPPVSVTVQQRERSDQTRQTRQKDPLTPTGEGSGSFKNLDGGRSGGFDIRDHLPDEDIHEIYRCYAVGLGWDVTGLYEKYNAYVANDPPRQPKAAFMGWVKKFTKGKRA